MSNIVMYWNEKAIEILKDVHTNPGHDTRRFAIIQIAIHDALNSVAEKYKRYASQVIPTPDASPQAAVTSAAYIALHWAITDVSNYNDKLKQENLPPVQFDANAHYQNISIYYNQKLADIPGGLAKTNGVLLGLDSAAAIIANRANDNCRLVDLLSSTPADGTQNGRFRADYYFKPAPPRNKFLVNYGKVKPFAITSASQFRQDPNYLNRADHVSDYNEVKEKGKLGYPHTPSDKDIIEVWSNNKQHIVWNNIASGLMATLNWDEWKTARLFALIHTAMADGTISMFKDVYHFYKWRPVTAINIELGVLPNNSAAWKPYKDVPRVAEYPSTFGILGGATGQILENIFTDTISFNVKALNSPTTISYTKISMAVDDITKATIYCGWNFRKSAVDGIKQGRGIGNFVFTTKFTNL